MSLPLDVGERSLGVWGGRIKLRVKTAGRGAPLVYLHPASGLQFDPFKGEIRLCNPRLPAFLDEVILRDLRLGSASVDLRVRRHKDTVSLDTPRISGDIRVSIVFSSS